DEKFNVAEFVFGRAVGAVAIINKFAVLDTPMGIKLCLLGCDGRLPFGFGCLDGVVGVVSIPPGEIGAVEEGAEAFRRGRVTQGGEGTQGHRQRWEDKTFHQTVSNKVKFWWLRTGSDGPKQCTSAGGSSTPASGFMKQPGIQLQVEGRFDG